MAKQPAIPCEGWCGHCPLLLDVYDLLLMSFINFNDALMIVSGDGVEKLLGRVILETIKWMGSHPEQDSFLADIRKNVWE